MGSEQCLKINSEYSCVPILRISGGGASSWALR